MLAKVLFSLIGGLFSLGGVTLIIRNIGSQNVFGFQSEALFGLFIATLGVLLIEVVAYLDAMKEEG